ncbi:SAM-dependent methyltransferase [Streptomyces carpaticus]|uniref:SAM-dependent methyltransferase n=1 Tax=Streptomyces carpaticus TaxID=285558 RepID=UPI0031F8D028
MGQHHRHPLLDSCRIDISVPSAARMYEFLMGGREYYEADRDACEELLRLAPGIGAIPVIQRRFLRRVVRYLAREAGIRQFIDCGSGLPAGHSIHEVARQAAPGSRVVYVDNDPIVVAHGRRRLPVDRDTVFVQADISDCDSFLAHPGVRKVIDFRLPVAVLAVSTLHCVPHHDPHDLVGSIVSRLSPGSFLALSQWVCEDDHLRGAITDFMRERTAGQWGTVQKASAVARYFQGLKLIPPGTVEVSAWRPDSQLDPKPLTTTVAEYGGLARIT